MTLEQIKENGVDGFYKGKVGELLVKQVRSQGGYITLENLKQLLGFMWNSLLHAKKYEISLDLVTFKKYIIIHYFQKTKLNNTFSKYRISNLSNTLSWRGWRR